MVCLSHLLGWDCEMAAILFASTFVTSNIQGKEEVVEEKHIRCCWPPCEIHEGMFKDWYLSIFYFISQFIWLSSVTYIEMAMGCLTMKKYCSSMFQYRSIFAFMKIYCKHFN